MFIAQVRNYKVTRGRKNFLATTLHDGRHRWDISRPWKVEGQLAAADVVEWKKFLQPTPGWPISAYCRGREMVLLFPTLHWERISDDTRFKLLLASLRLDLVQISAYWYHYEALATFVWCYDLCLNHRVNQMLHEWHLRDNLHDKRWSAIALCRECNWDCQLN